MIRHAPRELPHSCMIARRSGFALVISLSLMAMMLLLVLSMTTLTTVELHNSTASHDRDRARENAMLGLKIAVARLQETVGPDQRFTATSAITGVTGNPNITGVWREDGTQAYTWLVSGNRQSDPLAISPTSLPNPATDAGASEVFLVNYGAVSRAEDRIKLPKEPVSSGAGAGHYAYWIGDEGVKVSMAINDETDQLDYDNTRPADTPANNIPGAGHHWNEDAYRDELRQMTLNFTNFWMLLGLEHADLAGSQKLDSISSLSMASMLPGTTQPDAWRDHFHTMTPLSRAVLINHTATDGSLRHDLSDSPQTDGSIKLFTRKRSVELASGHLGHVMLPFSKASHSDVFPHFSIAPVLTEFVVRFNFYRNSQGKLTIKRELQVELWNPYTTPIETPSRLFVELEAMPIFDVSVDGETYSVDPNDYFKDDYGRGTYIPTDVEWASGEIKWFKGTGGVRRLAADGPAGSELVLDSNGDEIDVLDPAGGTPVSIRVRVPGLSGENESRFTVRLWTHDDIALYRPKLAYEAVDVSNSSPTLDSSEWQFGYAFEMDDLFARWVDGSRADAADPRRVDMDTVDFADHDYEYWSDDPADTLGEINLTGSDTFNTQQNYRLYDLPTQEPVTVGALTHLIGLRPNMLGNAWGDTANKHFDRYFFSTLPRWYEWDLDSPPLLPNRYLDFYLTGQEAIEIGDIYASSGLDVDIMFDVYHAAKYLMIRGAFNINSTSVDAWRAMLGGIHIQDWAQTEYGDGTERDLAHTFFRHSFHGQSSPTAPDEPIEADTAFSRSGVSLTADQVDRLAHAVAAAIVARGYPFDSLMEFINAGIIDQAIEDTAVNQTAEDLGIVKNSPAYLTQADVIKAIAPMLTPRSDTFLVRSYGDVTDPLTGEVTATAWCEAVVQRTPALTQPVSGEMDLARDPVSPNVNQYPYGRQMKILSIRYLNPDEV